MKRWNLLLSKKTLPVWLNSLLNRVFFIAGDATEDKVLIAAGMPKSKGVVTTLTDDSENLMITMACKDFNPAVRVVARANRPESIIMLKGPALILLFARLP